MNEIKVLGELV